MKIYLIFSFFLLGCTQPTYLITGIDRFPKELVSHFPSDSKNFSILGFDESYPDVDFKLKEGAYYRAVYLVNSNINFLINELDSLAISKHSYLDSCLLFLPMRDFEGKYPIKPMFNNCNDSSFIPLPRFINYIVDTNLEDGLLKGDYIYYILSYKKGDYISTNLQFEEGVMPNNLNHGYSRGVAVSIKAKLAIYWLELW
jgi:hypothetical protein